MKKKQYEAFIENAKKTISYKLLEVFIGRLGEASDYEDEDAVIYDILDSFIYYKDQWEIMKEYSAPIDNKTFDECVEMFADDLYSCF